MQLVHVLHNRRDSALSYWLEPWAEQFEIPAGSALKLLCDCRQAEHGTPIVEVTEDLLVYSFGSGSRVRVWLDDVEVTSPASGTVPSP